MIVRQWRAWASYAGADQYEQHFREHVIPHLRTIEGFVRADLLRRDNYGVIEFVAQTHFRVAGRDPGVRRRAVLAGGGGARGEGDADALRRAVRPLRAGRRNDE